MRFIISVCAFIAASSVFASEVPKEFLGDWVPRAASCQSELKFRVEPRRVILQNGATTRTFGDIDICFSCEGGAKYDGKIVWLMPEFNSNNPLPFTVYFNAEEKLGVTKIDIQDSQIQKTFPLNGVALKKCK